MSTDKVRAKVWSTPDPGRNRPGRRATRTWHYAVMRPDGKVVLYDNTGHYDPIIKAAIIRVEALRHMVTAGHKLGVYAGSTRW